MDLWTLLQAMCVVVQVTKATQLFCFVLCMLCALLKQFSYR